LRMTMLDKMDALLFLPLSQYKSQRLHPLPFFLLDPTAFIR